MIDDQAIITMVNDRLCEMSGWTREELVGHNVKVLLFLYSLCGLFVCFSLPEGNLTLSVAAALFSPFVSVLGCLDAGPSRNETSS